MAEHEDINFEHEINEQLKKLDSRIRMPEIPDAQGIFELAEKKKSNVIPFAKYKKFAGIAAAVVLVFISLPVVSGFIGGEIGFDMAANEAAEAPMEQFDEPVAEYAVADSEEDSYSVTEESESGSKSAAEEPAAAPEYNLTDGSEEKSAESYDLESALDDYFYRAESSNSAAMGVEDAVVGASVSEIAVELNSKRRIDISVEGDSVSVMLYDTSADDEIISAFWVEGIYQNSGEENGKYYINLSKKITKEDFENKNYFPMAGDAEKGGYIIDESMISVSKEIKSGTINIRVEIDIASGDYEIKASVV